MSLKIYLLCHGKTEYSQRGAYCEALDSELTAEGHQMADAAQIDIDLIQPHE
jgi:broad specificity phosphatase PhoE